MDLILGWVFSGWAFSGLLTDEEGRWGGSKKALSLKPVSHTLQGLNFATVIPDTKNIKKKNKSRNTPLKFYSEFFHRKSANFPMSRNTDIDSILIHSF